jgi:nickel/cobalt transporter (NicO) family protein
MSPGLRRIAGGSRSGMPRAAPLSGVVAGAALAVFAACVLAGVSLGAAHAQSSLGIGANEAVAPSTGLFAGLMNWINLHQQNFYRALTGAMKAMRDSRGQSAVMIGLSFAYGVFHAAGPGHGKAVISSYMLANEVALKRGVVLSFVSAFFQAATAVLVMAMLFLALRGTAIGLTNATRFLEIASYGLITLFGAWLLWRKAWPRLAVLAPPSPAGALSAAIPGGGTFADSMRSGGASRHCAPASRSFRVRHADAGPAISARAFNDEACADCGRAHAPDPAILSGERFDWRTAWTAVAAVGLRPCSGALIVLSFSFLNGLFAAGIVSVLSIALGTALTVAFLATLAVTAKDWAVRAAGNGRGGERVHAAIEIGGAALVFLLGLALLSASLSA